MHDKKIADKEKMKFPDGIALFQDTGFVGFVPDNVLVVMNEKKPKGNFLTDEQKENNKLKSRERITIEHIICGIKRLRVVKDICRLQRENILNKLMIIACGLHNLRTLFRTNSYST